MTVYDKIDNILSKIGMSRRKLASIIDMPASTFQSMMSRKRGLAFETAEKIADALDINVFELWGYNTDEWKAIEEEFDFDKQMRYDLYSTIGHLTSEGVYDTHAFLAQYILDHPDRISFGPESIHSNTLFPIRELTEEEEELDKEHFEAEDN